MDDVIRVNGGQQGGNHPDSLTEKLIADQEGAEGSSCPEQRLGDDDQQVMPAGESGEREETGIDRRPQRPAAVDPEALPGSDVRGDVVIEGVAVLPEIGAASIGPVRHPEGYRQQTNAGERAVSVADRE